MTNNPRPLTDRDLERAVRSLPLPTARPEFRDELRARFLPRSSEDLRVEVASSPMGKHLSFPWKRVVAAAALITAIAVLWLDKKEHEGSLLALPEWTASSIVPNGQLLLNGASVRVPRLAGPINIDAETRVIEVVNGTMQFVLDGQFVAECPPGTAFELGAFLAPRGKRKGYTTVKLNRGEMRVASSPDFHGNRLAINTSEADVLVTGTEFVVEKRKGATCVCSRSGTVQATPKAGDKALAVTKNSQHMVITKDGNVTKEPLQERHKEALERLSKFWSK